MRILFLNPPFRDQHFSRSQRSPGVIKLGTMYYPYWLAHAAALAASEGHKVSLLDCPADGVRQAALPDAVGDFSPDLVVCDSSTPSFVRDLEVVEQLRECSPHTRTCLVGTHATAEWRSALDRAEALDFVAIGEYDRTVVDLASALECASPDFSKIPGLASRGADSPVRGPTRMPIADMDLLPWISPIYKRFLTPGHYRFTFAHHPMVMLIGGRGCIARCFYCVYPQLMHGHVYRTRSPEHLVGEMRWIQTHMPEVREIVFEDDTFTANAKRAREIARLVRESRLRLPFFANLRTNVDYETLAALRESGLRQCATGFESGDNLILANMRKGQNVDMQHRFMESCRKLGILVHGCFMVGFPGETEGTMQRTLELALSLDPDSAQFYPVMPYPGTGAYQWAQENGYLATDQYEQWLTGEGGHRCVLNLPGLSPEKMEAFCERAFRAFHFRPRYLARKGIQALKQPREGARSLYASLRFVYYLATNQRGSQADQLPPQPVLRAAEEWSSRVRVPYGRMERMERALPRRFRGKETDFPEEVEQELRVAEEDVKPESG